MGSLFSYSSPGNTRGEKDEPTRRVVVRYKDYFHADCRSNLLDSESFMQHLLPCYALVQLKKNKIKHGLFCPIFEFPN